MTKHTRYSRVQRLAIGASLYLGALALGMGSAWWVLRKATWSGTLVKVGAWSGSTLTGSPDADMYTRARVALEGLLALGRNETMYYRADTDDSGRPLRSRCSYPVEGAPNKQYSLNGTTAQLDAVGHFALSTGPTPQPGLHWLPTPGDRGLVLTLRLYNPTADLQAAPSKLKPPSISPLGACP